MECTLTKQLADSGSFWIINKELAEYITLVDIVVLMEHVYQYDRLCSILHLDPRVDHNIQYELRKKHLCHQLGTSKDTIRRVEEKLLNLGLLRTMSRKEAFGRANQYALFTSNVIACFSNPEEYLLNSSERKVFLGSQRLKTLGDAAAVKANEIHSNDANHALHAMQTTPTLNNNTITVAAGATPGEDLRSYKHTECASTSPTSDSSNLVNRRKPSSQRNRFGTLSKDEPPSATALERKLLPETIEVINFWNTMPNLRKQKIVYSSRTTCRYALQLKGIQHLDNFMKDILAGKFYADRPDVTVESIKHVKFGVSAIKIAIERFNRVATFEYSKDPTTFKKYAIHEFFFRPAASLFMSEDKRLYAFKYLFKYPFIYCTLTDPSPLSQRELGKAQTKYPVTVNGVIELLKSNSGYKSTVQNYSNVVHQVDRAVNYIKTEANGSSDRIIRNLPNHLAKCMKGIHIDHLYHAVEYKLVPYLRSIREIK